MNQVAERLRPVAYRICEEKLGEIAKTTGMTPNVFVMEGGPDNHIGHELSGVMEVTSFAKLETFDEAESTGEETRERKSEKLIPTSVEPFVLTWKMDADKVQPAFLEWLDACLATALKK